VKKNAEEIAQELWVAREILSIGHRPPKSGTKVPLKTWSQYCQDIGSSRQVVNRWLNRFFLWGKSVPPVKSVNDSRRYLKPISESEIG